MQCLQFREVEQSSKNTRVDTSHQKHWPQWEQMQQRDLGLMTALYKQTPNVALKGVRLTECCIQRVHASCSMVPSQHTSLDLALPTNELERTPSFHHLSLIRLPSKTHHLLPDFSLFLLITTLARAFLAKAISQFDTETRKGRLRATLRDF